MIKAFAEQRRACQETREDLYDRVVDELDPDVVVVVNRGYEAARSSAAGLRYLDPGGTVLPTPSAKFEAWLTETTESSLRHLAGDSRRVVVIEPIPYPSDDADVLACLSDADVVEACRYTVDAAPSAVERLYRRIDAEDERIWAADLDELVCPFAPICDPIVDGMVVKLDASHLTGTYAESLAPAVSDYLRANGIIG